MEQQIRFQVTSEFLFSKTSGVSIEICSVGYLRDHLIGTVRLLLSNFLPTATVKVPFRLSSCFRSVVLLEISTAFLTSRPWWIGDRRFWAPRWFLQVRSRKKRLRVVGIWERKMIKSRSAVSFADHGGSSKENSLSWSVNFSDVGTDSMWSSPLRDWNAIRNQAGKNQVSSSSDGGGLLDKIVGNDTRKLMDGWDLSTFEKSFWFLKARIFGRCTPTVRFGSDHPRSYVVVGSSGGY